MPKGILKLLVYGDAAALFVSVIDFFTDEGRAITSEAVLVRRDDYRVCESIYEYTRETRIVSTYNGDMYAIDSLEKCSV